MDTAPEIIVSSRDTETRDFDREQITDRLGRLERYNSGVTRYEVELDHELNPRQSKTSERVTITGRGTGPTVHADACGTDLRDALEGAVGKLEEQLRRRRDRRRLRHDRAHRAASERGRASTLRLVADDTSSTRQPGDTPTSPAVAPRSSHTADAEGASSWTALVAAVNEPGPSDWVADGAGSRPVRKPNSGDPES